MLSFPPRLFIRFIDLFLSFFLFFFWLSTFLKRNKGNFPLFYFYSFLPNSFPASLLLFHPLFLFLFPHRPPFLHFSFFFLFFSFFFPRHATYTFLRFHLPFAPSFYLSPRCLCVAATALPSLVPFASSKFRYCQYHKSVRCARLKIDDTHH